MALPTVLVRLFGKPDAIFAPDPSVRKEDDGQDYDYIRPLATIEPTAISVGLPVDTSFGYDDIGGLRQALDRKIYGNALVLVAWEHDQITRLARKIIDAHGGNPDTVPKWHGKDFDSLYVIKITRRADTSSVRFEQKAQGLDGQSPDCPQ